MKNLTSTELGHEVLVVPYRGNQLSKGLITKVFNQYVEVTDCYGQVKKYNKTGTGRGSVSGWIIDFDLTRWNDYKAVIETKKQRNDLRERLSLLRSYDAVERLPIEKVKALIEILKETHNVN
jgi:hypothetical protein